MHRKLAEFLLAALLLAATGCTTLRMVPPADVAEESDVIEATDRSLITGFWAKESFKLGPYEVAGVDRDSTSSSGSATSFGSNDATLIGWSNEDIVGGFDFEFREGAETLRGRCGSLIRREGFTLANLESGSERSQLACACGRGQIELEGGEDGPSAGRVSIAGRTLDVAGVYDTNAAYSSSEPVGFRVDEAGKPLGAVEVLHPGRIWLNKSLEGAERRQLSCLLTGVMLYKKPVEH